MKVMSWMQRTVLMLALCAGLGAGERDVLADPRTDQVEALALLFVEANEAELALDPLGAMRRGDMRHAAQFGDYVTPEYFSRLESNAREWARRLAAIDRSLLTAQDRIAYDAFAYRNGQLLDFFERGLMTIEAQLPIEHFSGFQVVYPEISSGNSVAPFNMLTDYDNGLKRLDGYVHYLDHAIERMREGKEKGHTQSRLVMVIVLEQLGQQLKAGVDASPFYRPIKAMPEEFSAADRDRLVASYRSAIGDRVFGAYRRLQAFIREGYLPACREAPGLVAMKDGAAYYQGLIERETTTTLTASEIHDIGLREVERIVARMDAIRERIGFDGTLPEFLDHLRTDPEFRFTSRQELLSGYGAVRARVEAAMPELFSLMPDTPFEIRPVPADTEQYESAASYLPGSADGRRPGVFYVNTYDLPSRTRPGMETLFLHEAIPGHHFQISLAQENEALPDFLRFDGNTAFTEGWALYAESLGPELGMFVDPYQAFGNLDAEMLRAIRLVVDTGIHAMGWSTEQAVDYMLEHSALSAVEARTEVERYIAIPAQALAYTVGALTIQGLRSEAEQALGRNFDPRAFHSEVLGTGALPLVVLEQKVREWIRAGGPAPEL